MPLQTRAQKPDSYGSSFNKSHLNPQVLVQNRSEEFIRNQNGDQIDDQMLLIGNKLIQNNAVNQNQDLAIRANIIQTNQSASDDDLINMGSGNI